MFDSDEKETTDSSKAAKLVYLIEVSKFLNGVSTSSIVYSKLKSTAAVKIELANEVQESSAPLSGHFKVKCIDKSNYASYTRDMAWNTHLYWIVQIIEQDCAGLYGKLQWI